MLNSSLLQVLPESFGVIRPSRFRCTVYSLCITNACPPTGPNSRRTLINTGQDDFTVRITCNGNYVVNIQHMPCVSVALSGLLTS